MNATTRSFALLLATLTAGSLASGCTTSDDSLAPDLESEGGGGQSTDEPDGGTTSTGAVGVIDLFGTAAQGGAGAGGDAQGGEGEAGAPNDRPLPDVPDGTSGLFPLLKGDTCSNPYDVSVGLNQTAHAIGTMIGANDDMRTFCADNLVGESSTETVVAITTSTACTLSFGLITTFNAALSFRTSCETDLFCIDARNLGVETLPPMHYPAGTYYAVVSDIANVGGAVDLTVTCTAPRCGDGAIGPDEACDDGNVVSGDGCDNCQYEAVDTSLDTCSGATASDGTSISAGTPLRLPGTGTRSTIGATDSGTGSCMYDPSSFPGTTASVDHVYKIIPTTTGTLTLNVGNDVLGAPFCGLVPTEEPEPPYALGCYDRAIHVRETTCDSAAAEVGCVDGMFGTWWQNETLSIDVVAGRAYYVFVDGFLNFGDGSDVGEYVLEATLN